MKASTRRLLKTAGILVAVLVTLTALFFGLWFASSSGSDRGSTKLASEWRLQLSEFSEPNSAASANERIWVIHCESGEWMFGLAQGSHGIWRRGGGTVVTKDSAGEICSYRGHVCSPSGSPFRGCSARNLATVYEEIATLGFDALDTDAPGEKMGSNKPVEATAINHQIEPES